jgi:hypothetical protein
MLRSKTGCKTELISRKERKTYFFPPFAISQNPQGSEVFSTAFTPCSSDRATIKIFIPLTGIWDLLHGSSVLLKGGSPIEMDVIILCA